MVGLAGCPCVLLTIGIFLNFLDLFLIDFKRILIEGIILFLRQSFIDASMVLDIGDLIDWNYGYFEVGSINENQLIGGMFNQNYSVVANTFLIRKSSIQIERVRSI